MFSNNVTDITNKRILGIFGRVPLVRDFSFLLKTRTAFGFFRYVSGTTQKDGSGQDEHSFDSILMYMIKV